MASAGRVEPFLRKLARDQWVRAHGTPRITVIAGGATARASWSAWAEIAGESSMLVDGNDGFDAAIRESARRAIAEPRTPLAVIAASAHITAWRAGRTDRLAAMVDEGLVAFDDDLATGGDAARRAHVDARSAAEAALFDALEAHPATAGKFELNGLLSVHFGSRPAEVDLVARAERIAVEIDGYHHFTDPSAYRRDRKKDLLLQTRGFLVVRVLAEDVVRDARDAFNAICAALAHRDAEVRR